MIRLLVVLGVEARVDASTWLVYSGVDAAQVGWARGRHCLMS